jgi:hypothetical protein
MISARYSGTTRTATLAVLLVAESLGLCAAGITRTKRLNELIRFIHHTHTLAREPLFLHDPSGILPCPIRVFTELPGNFKPGRSHHGGA